MSTSQKATPGFVLAIDQGTTGSTVLIIDVRAKETPKIISKATIDFLQHYPKSGWVEHDLNEIWHSVEQATLKAIALATPLGFSADLLAGIGITNQRETLCTFERASGRPLSRAIVWQCRRSTEICGHLKADGCESEVREKTGLVLDPYFSGSKITWIMENDPEVASKLQSGQGVLGTIDTFLIHRLTDGQSFVTEASNASRTLLYDINMGQYDNNLLKMFRVPSHSTLPEVRDSAGSFGKTKGLSFLPDGIPITGVLGDQQAALAGQACFDVAEAKCTYGTGAFLLLNLGPKPLASTNGLLTTIAWSLAGRKTYAFEGASFIAGAAMQFLRDQLGFIKHASESFDLAKGVTAAPEVYFVPALAGLSAPYWNPKARGAFLGLTRGTEKAQLIRAALEGMAFQVSDLISAMIEDSGRPMALLRVDGGAAANDLLLQIQADYSGCEVDRPKILETTAFGASLFAALGAGVYRDLSELKVARIPDQIFQPRPGNRDLIAGQLQGWQRAVKAVTVFSEVENP